MAYGAIPAGLGSDTGGSLRVPAACCGVASIKPTWGRVSRAGAMPLAPQLDTVGVIARHVEDLALMLGFLAGPDPRDPSASTLPVPDYLARLDDPVAGLKVGLDEKVIGEAHPDVQRMVEHVVADARQARSEARALRLSRLADARSSGATRAAARCRRPRTPPYLRTRPDDYGPQVRARVEVGHFVSAVDHLTALRARGTYVQRTLDQTFKDIDIAILPILADPLPTIAELDVGGGPKVQAAMGRVVKYTRPVNYLGLPTLTLPVPRGGGLPNGIQLVGKPFAEGLLFAIGQAYQREVPPEIARPLQLARTSGRQRPARSRSILGVALGRGHERRARRRDCRYRAGI